MWNSEIKIIFQINVYAKWSSWSCLLRSELWTRFSDVTFWVNYCTYNVWLKIINEKQDLPMFMRLLYMKIFLQCIASATPYSPRLIDCWKKNVQLSSRFWNYAPAIIYFGARGSVRHYAKSRNVAGSTIFPAALGPGVYSSSNRNEYQKQKNNNVYGE
jgi:hypothetical protein